MRKMKRKKLARKDVRWQKKRRDEGNLLHGAAEPGSWYTGHHLLPEEGAHLFNLIQFYFILR